ncbi:MAG: hypothetical protein EOP93_03105 [Lysobacteraceae bacterium]|nr:MAG: hypothetical protein EOP93_03105 [Xanthomonadaceae bacterium]
MNEHDYPRQRSIGDAELRMALRGLRQDAQPGNDLWPGIAARIAALPRQSQATPAPPRQRWLWPLATAASLLVAVGVSWNVQPGRPAPGMSGTPIAITAAGAGKQAPLVQREAETLTVQYRAALREIDATSVPAGWQPGLDALDRSADEIRLALQHDPNSRLLLQRLRDTYTRRLALSRRSLYV